MKTNDKKRCSFILLLSLFFYCCGHDKPQCQLCYENDTSCSHMVAGCKMHYIPRNSPECRNLQLSGSHGRRFGDVKLETYMHYAGTAFNLTASITSPIRPLTIKFKYQVNNDINSCRIFTIDVSNESTDRSPFTLFYDCLWSTVYDGREVEFEYEVSDGSSGNNEYRSLSCRVPWSNYSDPRPPDLGLLLCVEVVDNIVVHWSPAQTEFMTKFRINITRCGSTEPFHTVEKYNTSSTHFERPSHGMCFFISLEPWLENKGAWGSVIKSRNLQTYRTIPMFVYIIGGFSLVIMLLAACVSWCFWETKKEINTKVLIVYSQSSENHGRVIETLVSFLKEKLNMKEVVYPERDIPPRGCETWFEKTMKNVDVVLVLSSPRNAPMKTAGTMCHTYIERDHAQYPAKIVKVVLPTSGDEDFSPCWDKIPCYHVCNNFGSLLRLLVRKSPWLIVPLAFYESELKAQLDSELKRVIRTNDTDMSQLLQVDHVVPDDPDSSSESESASLEDLSLLEMQNAIHDRLRRANSTEPSDVESKDSQSI